MRQFSTILAALLPAIVPAIAHDVRIAMFDTQRSSSASHGRSVSPETATLILERRLGQPGSSAVGEAGEQVIQDINEFGGRQLELFESESQETRRLFLAFEGTGSIDSESDASKDMDLVSDTGHG